MLNQDFRRTLKATKIPDVCRYVIAVIFIISGFVKTIDPEKLNKMVEKYMFQEEGKLQQDNNWSAEHVVKWLEQLKPEKFKKALQHFEKEEKVIKSTHNEKRKTR